MILVDTTVRGEPVVFARPRFTAGGKPYQDAEYRAARDALSWELRGARKGKAPAGVEVRVRATFFRSTARTVDLDNLIKAVLDAGNEVLWDDDKQVFHIDARKVLGVGVRHACTRLIITTMED